MTLIKVLIIIAWFLTLLAPVYWFMSDTLKQKVPFSVAAAITAISITMFAMKSITLMYLNLVFVLAIICFTARKPLLKLLARSLCVWRENRWQAPFLPEKLKTIVEKYAK